MRDDPEALAGMVDEGNGFAGGWGDGVRAAEEIEGGVGIETALEVEGQMEVEKRPGGDVAVVIAFFLEGEVPGSVGDQAGGAANMVLIVPGDLGLEERVGVFVVGDLFIGQEGAEALLEDVEAAFDFAFGGGVWGDAVGAAQGGESALELGMGVETVGWRAMAKEGESVGIEASRWAVGFQGRANVGKVIPGGIAADEGAGDDFAGVVVEGEDQHRVMVRGPPRVGRAVVLPEFADGTGLPAAAGFGPALGRGHLLGKMLADIGGDGGAGTGEVVAAGQFAGQEGEIERLAVG